MQFQADLLNVQVARPELTETTAMGAAYLAGIAVGIWSQETIYKNVKRHRDFMPNCSEEKRDRLYTKWKKAVERTKDWM